MDGEKTKLVSTKLLQAFRNNGGTNREIAEGANVSFRAVKEAREGIAKDDLEKPRKRIGAAESLTRLALYLDVDPLEVINEIKLDLDDPLIRRYVEKARASASRDPREPFVSQIRRRLLQCAAEDKPLMGILNWEPFHCGEVNDFTFGAQLGRMLLGAIDPGFGRSKHLRTWDDFRKAEEEILSAEEGNLNLFFGLYDLPWRRGSGVDVVPLPGLSVRLGGITATDGVGWFQILVHNRLVQPEKKPHVICVKGDAGSILLNGVVGYPTNQLTELDTDDPRDIAKHLNSARNERAEPVAFVGHGPLTTVVKHILVEERNAEFFKFKDTDLAPTYQFGIGMDGNDPSFKALIEMAISQELFGRAFPKTVDLYLQLLQNDARFGHIKLDLTDLCRMHSGMDSRFVKLALLIDREGTKELLKDVGVSEKLIKSMSNESSRD